MMEDWNSGMMDEEGARCTAQAGRITDQPAEPPADGSAGVVREGRWYARSWRKPEKAGHFRSLSISRARARISS